MMASIGASNQRFEKKNWHPEAAGLKTTRPHHNRPARRQASISAILALATALASPAVMAQTADPSREARALFDQGIAASDAGRYADAVTAFERSLQLRPSPVVLRNLGVAYRGVGRLLDAIRAFDQYFANPGRLASQSDLAQLRAEYEAIQREVPELRFDVAPEGAAVRVDGREVSDPAAVMRIDPGRHVVEISKDDYRPQRVEMDLQRSERRTITARLEQVPADGRVGIETNVQNARIELDGALVGTQSATVPATPGNHSIVVTAPGYQPLRRRVTVGRHGLARVSIVLVRTPGLSPLATGLIVGGASLVGVAVITGVVIDRTRDRFVPPEPPQYWGEIAFPP
jgi:hypothetical protein